MVTSLRLTCILYSYMAPLGTLAVSHSAFVLGGRGGLRTAAERGGGFGELRHLGGKEASKSSVTCTYTRACVCTFINTHKVAQSQPTNVNLEVSFAQGSSELEVLNLHIEQYLHCMY